MQPADDPNTMKSPLLASAPPAELLDASAPEEPLPEATVLDVLPGTPDVAAGGAHYYTQSELERLQTQPAPPEQFFGAANEAPAPVEAEPVPIARGVAATAALAEPVLTTAQGVPVVATARAASRALARRDGRTGLKSCDELLQTPEELMLFLQTHNTRPYVACRVTGFHHETRTREVTRKDRHGRRYTDVETYRERVEDFKYDVDLSDFVFPFGYIYNDGAANVPAVVNRYLADGNSLKTLQMKKIIVDFPFHAFKQRVENRLRALGWRRELTVEFPKANNTVRVYADNRLSRAWEHPVTWFLFPWFRKTAATSLKSAFRIPYSADHVFGLIEAQLWCPGWSGAAAAMEALGSALEYGIVARHAGRGRRGRRRRGRRW